MHRCALMPVSSFVGGDVLDAPRLHPCHPDAKMRCNATKSNPTVREGVR